MTSSGNVTKRTSPSLAFTASRVRKFTRATSGLGEDNQKTGQGGWQGLKASNQPAIDNEDRRRLIDRSRGHRPNVAIQWAFLAATLRRPDVTRYRDSCAMNCDQDKRGPHFSLESSSGSNR
ncbi:hypothetical protein Btru_056879 [Bulinus truncatus]|nr:hypothetical protein Btru_056879 [Bulinus truncatus]